MSESKEHKRRYNAKLEFVAEFTRWLEEEPPRMACRKWRKWKRRRPILTVSADD